MIPRIANLSKVDAKYHQFLQSLADQGFTGEIEERYSARLLCATDNSVYQKMPQAVVFPRSKQDVALLFKLAAQEKQQGQQGQQGKDAIVFAPRGGGTGTNGQSLCSGIIIDMSRHMKGVRDLDVAARSVWVEAGVIKDELNEQIAPDNLFFSPELSTSSRATIGGMISNDAAGQGSLKYGRTSQHILEVEVVLNDGTLTTFKPVSGDELQECLQRKGLEGQIYRKCYTLLKDNAAAIEEHFPHLNRFLTGYDLHHAYDPATDTLNLVRLICGAEGTLATVVGAKLDLTLKPSFRALCVIKYENFIAALRHANELIATGAFSVETVDSKVLGLAKKDPVWLQVQDYIQEVPNAEILGVNIVEFNGYDAAAEQALMHKLHQAVLASAQTREKGILGAQLAESPAAIAAVYGMRKKAVGLLGSAAGSKKLVPFTEDTVVPPQHLADYIQDFRALLDSMQVEYGMFGHVDTGLMHVRPALDLTLDSDKEKLVKISHGVVELVKKYGGQMWGEHGRGYRSCFGEVFFGKLYPLARQVKAIFDAHNSLNPGKICVPWGNDTDRLVVLDDPMRGDLDRLIAAPVRESFIGALNCNGNGQCFSYSRAALMCPSYRYTKDHVKSPKGYSGLMREWLRLMTERQVDIIKSEQELLEAVTHPETQGSWSMRAAKGVSNWLQRAYHSFYDHDDFHHEYLGHVATCLACKSCKTQCPAHVNAAELNSRFLHFYYSRYLRPRMDLLTLQAESTIPWFAKFPRLSNALAQTAFNRYLVAKVFNFTDLPWFSPVNLASHSRQLHIPVLSSEELEQRAAHYDVVVVTDAFTSAYEADGVSELAQLIQAMGFRVVFLKPYTNGKLFVIRGARGKFIKAAAVQAQRLVSLQAKGLTLVGYDPAFTICYRDEYPSLVPNCPDFKVLLPEEWLQQALASGTFKDHEARLQQAIYELTHSARAAAPAALPSERNHTMGIQAIEPCDFTQDFYLFCHCTEQALVPLSVKMWQEVFAHFGMRLLPIPVACCGMAGLFGHIVANQEESRKVYEQNWQDKLRAHDFKQCLVTGFSCRSQVQRQEKQRANHPIHVLCSLLQQAKQRSH